MTDKKSCLSHWPYWIIVVIFWTVVIWQGVENCGKIILPPPQEEINQSKIFNK